MTIHLADLTAPPRPISLGEYREFGLKNAEPGVEVTFFLMHDGICYLQPLNGNGRGSVVVAIEAPGRYTLCAVWRAPGGLGGREEIHFEVPGPSSSGPPQVVDLGWSQRASVPSPWEAAVSARHEEAVIEEASRRIAPGATVYDIGANLGQFAIPFARHVGPSGRVYCCEANPVCVYFLRANLESTGLRNFEILPVCVVDGSRPCDFTINYGNNLLGLLHEVSTGKAGHRIQVHGRSLDELIATLDLRSPDFVKLDVEGGEGLALAGMRQTLDRSRPNLLLELHGRQAAQSALTQLAGLDYEFKEIAGGRAFRSAGELSAWFPDRCLQILGLTPRA